MNTFETKIAGIPVSYLRVEACIILYLQTYGQINSLDRWAHDVGYSPWWVRQCAHTAERKGLVKLTRMVGTSGQPYRVTLGGEA